MDLEEEYDLSYNDEDEDEITQEDGWVVIIAYFEEKGLLDSFDEFIQKNTMQEIIDELADIVIRLESQHNPGHQADFTEVPIMLRSSYYTLYQNSKKDLTELGKCPYMIKVGASSSVKVKRF
ncbi:hypothetical protein HYC85_021058 [Camellia sinensis]|uniref:DNA-directed RNA polymerase n=1 Tax=Camellia sinensis TaxID=4442 RepID=A0A7J7GIX2_CAMSI|nr:hypothetical protein HYC85_021058 [Camellia sinensis]